MAMPRVIPAVARTLKTRVCNTRNFVATATPQEIVGYDNNRQGCIIQNLDPVNTLFLSFNQSNGQTTSVQVPPTGNISFDFAIAEKLYAFTAGASVNVVILEITGFDTFQMLTARLAEMQVDRLGIMVDLLTEIARASGVSPAAIARARQIND